MNASARSNREAAGQWLREQRKRHGFDTVGSFARAIGVDTSRVSNYENGRNEVPEDRAERIAEVLGLDIITVRRNLGMWVPKVIEESGVPPEEGLTPEEILAQSMALMDQLEARAGDPRARQAGLIKEWIRLLREEGTPDSIDRNK